MLREHAREVIRAAGGYAPANRSHLGLGSDRSVAIPASDGTRRERLQELKDGNPGNPLIFIGKARIPRRSIILETPGKIRRQSFREWLEFGSILRSLLEFYTFPPQVIQFQVQVPKPQPSSSPSSETETRRSEAETQVDLGAAVSRRRLNLASSNRQFSVGATVRTR